MYYWELVLKDGTRYEIPPDKVAMVNKKMSARDPLLLSTATILYADIDKFRQTSKPYSPQPLLEAVAQAFDEPVYSADGSMVFRWVKKLVTQAEYRKDYNIPAYRKLSEDGGMVTVAYKLAVHDIDLSKVQYCDVDDIVMLTKR